MSGEIGRLIDVAAGRRKASLVLKNARVVNVFTQEIIPGDIAIEAGKIAGIGRYEGDERIDLCNAYALPGFIDGHVHLESALVTPSEFARAVLPRGTTSVVADPHEIANVCGIQGIRYMLEASEGIGLDVFYMLPSCVPATPHDSPGARLEAEDLLPLACENRILGLGEMMDFRGVVAARPDIIRKLKGFRNRIMDGHAPGLTGMELNAYKAAGIATDHECTTQEEMLEKIRLGFHILIREGSAAKDLDVLIRGVNERNIRRCVFCTDDRHLTDILQQGHIDNNIRQAVQTGMDPVAAIMMATLNAAECYGLKDRGALAPGYRADIAVVKDLQELQVEMVLKDGSLIARDGQFLPALKPADPAAVTGTVRIVQIQPEQLAIRLKSRSAWIMAIEPGSLITRKVIRDVSVEDGFFVCRHPFDPVKVAVVERHKASGRVGVGLLEGFGIRNGAVASSISHDSHNLIAAGDNDRDMLIALEELARCGGGVTLSSEGKVLCTLSLPVAGLMSMEPYETVNDRLKEMLELAYRLGVKREIEPFMTLSFLALTVIPEIRITDRGVFDVTADSWMDPANCGTL